MAGSVDVCCGCVAYPLGLGIGKKLEAACLAPMLIVSERFFDD